MEKELSRRTFVKGAALASIAGAALGIAGCSEPTAAEGKQTGEAADIAWTDEADVVILGTGGAGLSAAITMADEQLGSCLVLEAAPENLRGGNSRICGQILNIPLNPEGAVEYQNACNEPYAVEPELMQAWAESLCDNLDWCTDVCGMDLVVTPNNNPEFPELPGADDIEVYVNGELGNSNVWNALAETADGLGTKYYYDSRVTDLVIDGEHGIVGVSTEDGRCFKAKKGVVMGCGGFEANEDLIKKYYQIGYADLRPRGSFYNRGEGIHMAEQAGAQLWHMNNMVGNAWGVQLDPEDRYSCFSMKLTGKGYIVIGPDGCRYQSEDDMSRLRHGKYNKGGVWANLEMPMPAYLLFDQECFDGGMLTPAGIGFQTLVLDGKIPTADELLERGVIKRCESAEDVAAFTGIEAATLQGTLDRWNRMAAQNSDTDFGRGTARDEQGYAPDHVLYNGKDKIAAYDLVGLGYPLYAMPLAPTFLNTQGGPKRNAFNQVLDMNDEPIARLYSTGELGAIYVNEYNGGGNFSDAIASGRVAARHCASLEAWDA